KLGRYPWPGKFSAPPGSSCHHFHESCPFHLYCPSGSRRRCEPCPEFSAANALCRVLSAVWNRRARKEKSWSERMPWSRLFCGVPSRPPTVGTGETKSANDAP